MLHFGKGPSSQLQEQIGQGLVVPLVFSQEIIITAQVMEGNRGDKHPLRNPCSFQGLNLSRHEGPVVFLFLYLFVDSVSLHSPGCPGTHSVDQAGLALRNPPASASQSAGITGVHHHCLAASQFLRIHSDFVFKKLQ